MKWLKKKPALYLLGGSIAFLAALACILFFALYFFPPRVPDAAKPVPLSYEQAVNKATSIQKSNQTKPKFIKNCDSKLYTHDHKTARSVVMLHGITSCPSEYSVLAKTFFDAGYNVYAPLAPKQGTSDARKTVASITTQDLANYVAQSYNVGAGLGESVGFVGISGGAALASWGVQHYPITNLLVLSPFYDPATQFMSEWQRPFLLSLYGRNLVPDVYSKDFSQRTLAKYLQFTPDTAHLTPNKNLHHVAVVTSANDPVINLDKAHIIPKKLAKKAKATFQQARLDTKLGIDHDIVDPIGAVAKHQEQLNNLYLSFYENKQPAKEL